MISLNYRDSRPIYEQIRDGLRKLIVTGALSADEKLPSVRALAAQLACQRYHLVLANIVADVIIPLSAQVPALLAEDGVFLCSGIIDTRAHEVEEALVRQGLTLTGRREKNGWVALEARRPLPRG